MSAQPASATSCQVDAILDALATECPAPAKPPLSTVTVMRHLRRARTRRMLFAIASTLVVLVCLRFAIPLATVYMVEPVDQLVTIPDTPRTIGVSVDGTAVAAPSGGFVRMAPVLATHLPRYRSLWLQNRSWVRKTGNEAGAYAASPGAIPGPVPGAVPGAVPVATATPSDIDGSQQLAVAVARELAGADVSDVRDVQFSWKGDVSGSSAGLAFALDAYIALSGDDLVRGRRIVATGEIAADGTVSTVDHVDLKGKGAADDGADIFLVPIGEGDNGRRYAGDDMQVIEVASVREAISVLEA